MEYRPDLLEVARDGARAIGKWATQLRIFRKSLAQ